RPRLLVPRVFQANEKTLPGRRRFGHAVPPSGNTSRRGISFTFSAPGTINTFIMAFMRSSLPPHRTRALERPKFSSSAQKTKEIGLALFFRNEPWHTEPCKVTRKPSDAGFPSVEPLNRESEGDHAVITENTCLGSWNRHSNRRRGLSAGTSDRL